MLMAGDTSPAGRVIDDGSQLTPTFPYWHVGEVTAPHQRVSMAAASTVKSLRIRSARADGGPLTLCSPIFSASRTGRRHRVVFAKSAGPVEDSHVLTKQPNLASLLGQLRPIATLAQLQELGFEL